MLNLFNEDRPKSKPDIEESMKQERELTLLNTERKIKGLTLFEYNKTDGTINLAEFYQNDTFDLWQEIQSKVIIKPNCVYVQALNKKNAIKHIKKKGYSLFV